MDDYEIIEPALDSLALAAPTKSSIQVPSFGSSVIESNRKDGYWVETFHFSSKDRVPGIIASGLVSGLIEFLDNPIAEAEHQATGGCKCKRTAATEKDLTREWTKYEIGKFNSPVAVVAVDITKNGLIDLVICHDYGPFMLECDPKGGHVTWLENPGRNALKNGHWKERYIGRWPAMHRVKAGHFTQKSVLEVVAASVVYGQHDKTTPIPIIRFQAPEKVLEATEWPRDIIDDENFTVIHEVTVRKFDGPQGLDSMLISSREGTTRLFYKNKQWHRDLISIGEPKEARQSPTSESPGSGDHWGTGCADAGKVGDDPFAYIATLDPFHGTTACVYTKENRGIESQKWKRHILDTYGTPNQQLKTGDGPGHFIVCADFDGDGDDEFLLSLFGPLDRDKGESIPPAPGPNPNKGIMYYKALDLENGVFAKWKIAEESSARLALGNFGGKGLLDFVSMKYNVDRYYEEPKPVVTLHLSQFASVKAVNSVPSIVPTFWDNEGMVYLRNPKDDKSVTEPSIVPLIEVAGHAINIEVYPKCHSVSIGKDEGVKIIYGSIQRFKDKTPCDPKAPGDKSPDPLPEAIRSPFGVLPFTGHTTTSHYSNWLAAKDTGAILLRLKPITNPTTYPTAADVPVSTKLDVSHLGITLPPLAFKKVDSLWWGKDNPFFKDVAFYNLSGFHFRFLATKQPIAHMQFWTAGTGVNCGVHNHSDNIFSEIHVSLSAGTKTGGMSRLKKKYEGRTPEEYNKLGEEAFEHLELKALEEHGGMWERDPYGRPVRGRENVVKYPWHKWQAGKGKDVDVWMALEFNPEL